MNKKHIGFSVVYHNVEQGSDEWRRLRCGLVTASRFADAIAGGQGKSRDLYMRQVAGEILSGDPMETFTNRHMEDGKRQEPELVKHFEMMENVDTLPGGVAVNGRFAASADRLIGDDGVLEIKREGPHELIARLEANAGFPPEHLAQVQGTLWVTEREYAWIGVGYRGMPMFRRRVRRDNAYIARLEVGLAAFVEQVDEMVQRVRAYGG